MPHAPHHEECGIFCPDSNGPREAYEVSEDTQSGDEAFGVLSAGTRVVDAFWYNLVGRPGKAPHFYTPSNPRVRVKVPTHLLLLAPVLSLIHI